MVYSGSMGYGLGIGGAPDPLSSIGDVESLSQSAAALRRLADEVTAATRGVPRGIPAAAWNDALSTQLDPQLASVSDRLGNAAHGLRTGASTLESLASNLRRLRDDARRVAQEWVALDRSNPIAVITQQYALHNRASSIEQSARSLRANARRELEAATQAAERGRKVVDDIEHRNSFIGKAQQAAGEFASGAWEAVKGTFGLAYGLSVGWFIDPKNHGDDWETFIGGLGYTVTHPESLLDLKTLEEKGAAYWLGGMVVGLAGTKGVGKAGAVAKAGGAAGRVLPVIRHTDGSYLAQAGRVSANFVKTVPGDSIQITSRIREQASYVSPFRIEHILDGPNGSDGHRPGSVPQPGKLDHTNFRDGWSDQKIIEAAQNVVADSNSTWQSNYGGAPIDGSLINEGDYPRRFHVTGTYDGESIRVIVEPADEGIITAYPYQGM